MEKRSEVRVTVTQEVRPEIAVVVGGPGVVVVEQEGARVEVEASSIRALTAALTALAAVSRILSVADRPRARR